VGGNGSGNVSNYMTPNGSSVLTVQSYTNGTNTSGSSKTVTLNLQGTSTGANTISGGVSDSGSGATLYQTILIKGSTGTWILGGTNTYTGTTSVTGGILTVTGSISSSSAVTVNGGTLNGTGTVSGTISVNNSSTSIIQGGTGGTNTGTLSTRALTFGGTSSVVAVACNTTAVSLIAVTGNLTTAGAKVNFSGALNAGTYTLFTFTGTLSGTLAIGTLPTGRTFSSFTYGASSITVTFT